VSPKEEFRAQERGGKSGEFPGLIRDPNSGEKSVVGGLKRGINFIIRHNVGGKLGGLHSSHASGMGISKGVSMGHQGD